MTVTTRRRLIAATAGLAAGAALPAGRANAAAPAAGRQAPGVYRYNVGDIEVTALTDGMTRRKLDDAFVRNAPVSDVRAALQEAFLGPDSVPVSFTTLVVNTGRRLILIDAGAGANLAPTAGQLSESMAAAGIDPKAIDAVVISHFHPDHIGGVRLKDGSNAFPNAELMVPEAEWAFWMDDGQMSRAPEAMKGAFRMARRVFEPVARDVARFGREEELAPGVTALPAPGHTPGHSAFRVSSGSEQLIVWSDTTNLPALFVRHPGWHVMFDMDATQAETTRRRMLDMASRDRLAVAGYHFPFPAVGHIARRGPDEYAFVPDMWNPAL